MYTAHHPLGPYTRRADLGNSEKAQQNYIFKALLANGTTAYVWTGDRWKSTPDGQKGHDFQYWQPLDFVNGGATLDKSAQRGTAAIDPLKSAESLPSFSLDLKVLAKD